MKYNNKITNFSGNENERIERENGWECVG